VTRNFPPFSPIGRIYVATYLCRRIPTGVHHLEIAGHELMIDVEPGAEHYVRCLRREDTVVEARESTFTGSQLYPAGFPKARVPCW
jgi:hypothetical protein